jgi:predicted Zn-dependent protease with MMP-like domain/Tfp pilus assembly protein PilF
MLDRDRYWDCLDQAMEASSNGQTDEALAWLEEALRANPSGAEAHNSRGEILWDNNRAEEALDEFERAIEADGEYQPAHLNRIEILIEEFQEHEDALDLSDELLQDTLEKPIEAEVYYLKAKALFYLDDLEGALFLLRRAIKLQGEVGIYRGFEGQVLFELGNFEEARRSLERGLALEPECAHSTYHMALVMEHTGALEDAERTFAKAARLAPEMYPLPTRIDDAEFEAAATQALSSLPEPIRRYTENCPVIVEDLPSEEMVRQEFVSPQVLGLFSGVPATEPGASPTLGTMQRTDTDRILLFKRNLEKIAMTRDELVEQIQITVKHEIGHFLGMDEEEVERLGLG